MTKLSNISINNIKINNGNKSDSSNDYKDCITLLEEVVSSNILILPKIDLDINGVIDHIGKIKLNFGKNNISSSSSSSKYSEMREMKSSSEYVNDESSDDELEYITGDSQSVGEMHFPSEYYGKHDILDSVSTMKSTLSHQNLAFTTNSNTSRTVKTGDSEKIISMGRQ